MQTKLIRWLGMAVVMLPMGWVTAQQPDESQVGTWQGPELLESPNSQAATNAGKTSGLLANETPFRTVAFTSPVPTDQATAVHSGDLGTEVIDEVSHSWSGNTACECQTCNHRFFQLEKPQWNFGGWLQQGITLNPSDSNNSNAPVLFNDRANDYQLNQLYFYLGKDVDPNANRWDIGGRLDLNYGTDSRFITVAGLERHDDRTRRWNSEMSDYGLALPQAFLELGTPVGPYGSSIRAGHFYAMSGYEAFAAPENFFYSHAYSFLYGQPFTHTGVMWTGKVTSTAAISLAGTTGWDALYDETNQWGIRYAFLKEFNDGSTTFSVTGHSGEDNTGIRDQSGARKDSRNWVSFLLKQHFGDRFYYVFQGDFGKQANAVVILDNADNTIGFEDASWYGINQYWVYQLDSQWSSGLRVEWFRDDGHSRLGLPVKYSNGGVAFDGGNYVAITGGLNYKPRQNVLLRSEIRWDVSDVESNPAIPAGVAGIRPFNNRSDDNQFTIGLDAIVAF